MARGALGQSGADIAVATTGVAGPGGGTPEKPIGLVWYGLAWKEGEKVFSHVTRSGFSSSRNLVRLFASHRALDLIRRRLLGLPLDYDGLGVRK